MVRLLRHFYKDGRMLEPGTEISLCPELEKRMVEGGHALPIGWQEKPEAQEPPREEPGKGRKLGRGLP